jgi:uncharacterized membrane protein YbhN (UPF0104 family)
LPSPVSAVLPKGVPLRDESAPTRSDVIDQPRTGKRWQAWAGVAVSAVFLFIAFRGQHPRDVLATLREVDLRWLPPALLLFAAGVVIRAARWSVLVRPVAPLSMMDVMPAPTRAFSNKFGSVGGCKA